MQKQQQDLSGEWKIRLDSDQSGLKKGYYQNLWREEESGIILLPGILQAQGYGNLIDKNTPWVSSLYDPMWYLREEYQEGQKEENNVPFLSQPPRHYLGWAWYQREVEILEDGQYQLFLECTRWKTTVWIDGEKKGSVTTLCSPHSYLLGNLSRGRHIVTILVDTDMQYPYRPDGHAVSDALAATWNGIVGEIYLKRLPDLAIIENQIWWDIDTRKVKIELILQNLTMEKKTAEIKAEGEEESQKIVLELLAEERKNCQIELFYKKDQLLWDEYNPNQKQIRLLCQCKGVVQVIEEQFGFRKIEARENGFFINNRPTYLRGTHFGGEFPLTGYPATKIEDWKRIFEICKRWGINFMRFHSYCPPKAAFLAADKVGFYLQIECGMWNCFSEEKTEELSMQEILYEETKRILAAFGNHPSFVLFSPSNEPAGEWWNPLRGWVEFFRSLDNRRLYTIQSGWPYPVEPKQITGTDYVYFHRSGFGPYRGGTIRNQFGWFGGDYAPSLEGIRYPVICHELGQWCSYPDFSIIEKFTGYMQPSQYKVFYAQAKKKGVLLQNKEFVYHSGRFQVAMYKEDLEANFRTPHIYGFELLDLHDYLGQGGAFIGVLDAFWEEKGYIQPEEFRTFCNETVLLLRMKKYLFTTKEQLKADAEIAHFGKEKKQETVVKWRLWKEEYLIKEEVLCKKEIPLGKNIPLGTIQISLADLDAPAHYKIELLLEEKEPLQNSWDFWLYQPIESFVVPKEDNIFCFTDVRRAKKALRQGKTVLLSPPSYAFSYWCPPLNPKPVFWNSQMGPRWDRGLGMICDPNHPAFAEFPTKSYEQWQWARIIEGARGIPFAQIHPDLKPLVQVIDDWNRSYKMALLFEAKVGKGKLLLSGCNLGRAQEDRPELIQLKQSLLHYLTSEAFQPEIELQEEEAFSWFQDTTLLQKLKATCWIEELPKIDCSMCISANPMETFRIEQVKFPLHFYIQWEKPIWINGLTYFPIQNDRKHRGEIREYEIWIWDLEKKEWVQKKEGEFATSFDPKEVFFKKDKTNKVMFVIKSGFHCEFYQKWEIIENGWRQYREEFLEDSVGIGKIALYRDESEEDENSLEREEIEIEPHWSGKTATLEIEE